MGEDPARWDSALSILGRTDIDSIGISGIELVYDGLLSGTDGERRVEMGMRGASIPGGEYSVEPACNGRTLVLTLDRALQFEAERLLLERVEAVGAKGGVLVAMHPATGEILVSATVRRSADGVVRISSEHRAVTWTYEPGSIIKPLTVSAILDRAVAAPDTVREVPPRLKVHDATFSDSPFPCQRLPQMRNQSPVGQDLPHRRRERLEGEDSCRAANLPGGQVNRHRLTRLDGRDRLRADNGR
jgi:cell division protein FtsI/penicillin-binding protein 2